jgi:hypothetical protein
VRGGVFKRGRSCAYTVYLGREAVSGKKRYKAGRGFPTDGRPDAAAPGSNSPGWAANPDPPTRTPPNLNQEAGIEHSEKRQVDWPATPSSSSVRAAVGTGERRRTRVSATGRERPRPARRGYGKLPGARGLGTRPAGDD